jgi:hypothetical protein
VDSDISRFTIELLQRWKIDREAQARRDLGRAAAEPNVRGLMVELHIGHLVEDGVGRTRKFLFKVANPNTRPATIVGAGIDSRAFAISVPIIKPEALWYPPRLALPSEITDGQSVTFSSAVDYFESHLRTRQITPPLEVIGYVTDALGNRHESNPTIYTRDDPAG